MNIYKSEFKFGPEATKKQLMLFNTDVAYAASEGYEYIQPVNGPVFLIDGNDLIEVGPELKTEQDELCESLAKALEESIEAEEPKCTHCHNMQLIDDIINNTLSDKVPYIKMETADTMIKLAQLQTLLIENHE